MAEPGRFGSFDVAVVGLGPFAARSLLNSSPSSEAMSVMREDMTLGARVEPAVGKGTGNELVVGERAEAGERGRSMSYVGFAIEGYSLYSRRDGWSDSQLKGTCLVVQSRERGAAFPLTLGRME